jgi:DNA polymerase delta subunit 1
MIEHNLCYSTECQTAVAKEMPNARYDCPQIECEDGSMLCPVFYQNEPGLLPLILTDLLHERGVAKKQMGASTSEDEKGVLNGRQLALKVSANSVYGFTGATMAKMPRLTISATVTYYGRLGLLKTKHLVESKYNQEYCYQTVLQKAMPAECEPWPTEVVGGDTDSVFVSFPVPGDRQGLLDSIQIAKIAAAECTDTFFKDPMELEYENTYLPLFLKEKKRYVAGKYISGHEILEDLPEDKWEQALSVKGLEIVRRDVPPFTSGLMIYVTIKLFIHRDIAAAYQEMTQQMERFCNRKTDIMELIMSGQLGDIDDYANPESLAHVNVVQKMRNRNPGSEPRTGDRVLYVYIKNSKSDKAADKAEDIGFVRENNLELDLEYYFEHKIYKPLIQLFEAVDPHVELRFQTWKQYVIAKNQGHGSVFDDLKKVGVNAKIAQTNEAPSAMQSMKFAAVDIKRKRKRSEIQTEVRSQVDSSSLTAMFGKPTPNTTRASGMPITSSVKKNTREKRSKTAARQQVTQNLDRSSLFGCTTTRK